MYIINNKIILLFTILLPIFLLAEATDVLGQELTGKLYERIDAPPWAMSILSPDTGKVYFPIKELRADDIGGLKIMLIRDYARFAKDGKGPNYLEVLGKVNNDGTFSIDLSKIKVGDLVVVVAIKKGFIKLWHSFRFSKDFNYKNMKIILVRVRQKHGNHNSKE